MSETAVEGTTAVLERPPIPVAIEATTRGGVREGWFQAYVKGNGLLPQTSLGLNLYVLDSVLSNPPSDWDEFSESELSDDQVQRIGRLMSNMHRSRGINRAHEPVASEGERPVDDERLRDLWTGPRDGSLALLLHYAGQADGTLVPMTKGQGYKIGDFFRDPRNSRKVLKLQESARTAREALDDVVVKRLAEIYKYSYDRENTPNQRVKNDPAFADLVDSWGLDSESDWFGRDLRNRALGKIRDVVYNRVSQVDLPLAHRFTGLLT